MIEKYGLQLAIASFTAAIIIALVGYPLARHRAKIGRSRILALRPGAQTFWVTITPELGAQVANVTTGGVAILSVSRGAAEVWLRRPAPTLIWSAAWEDVEDVYAGPVHTWTDSIRDGLVIASRASGEMRVQVWSQNMRGGRANCEDVASEIWATREKWAGNLEEGPGGP